MSRKNHETMWLSDSNIDIKEIRGEAENCADKMAEHGVHWNPTDPTRETAKAATYLSGNQEWRPLCEPGLLEK